MDTEKRIVEIQKQLDILVEKLEKKNNNFDFEKSKSFHEWEDYQKPESEQMARLGRELRMLKIPEFEEIPEYGDVMSLEDFIDNVKAGGFIDYDGNGNYARDGKMSDIVIHPSDVRHGSIRDDFDTIVWFNR